MIAGAPGWKLGIVSPATSTESGPHKLHSRDRIAVVGFVVALASLVVNATP